MRPGSPAMRHGKRHLDIPVETNLLSGEMETTIPVVGNHVRNRLTTTCISGQPCQALAAQRCDSRLYRADLICHLHQCGFLRPDSRFPYVRTLRTRRPEYSKFGRQVNKGEKAIKILAPAPYKTKSTSLSRMLSSIQNSGSTLT